MLDKALEKWDGYRRDCPQTVTRGLCCDCAHEKVQI